jgi:DNA-binding transcriptional LysR family regulator
MVLQSRRRQEVLELVQSGVIDLGIIPGPDRRPEVEYEPLYPYERVLITPLRHPLLAKEPLALEDLAGYPLILLPPHTATREVLEAEFQRRGPRYEVALELDSMDMVKRYVALGMGVSVGPAFGLETEDREQVGVVSLASLLPIEQVAVATLKGKYLSPPVQTFRAALQRELRRPEAGQVPRRPGH